MLFIYLVQRTDQSSFEECCALVCLAPDEAAARLLATLNGGDELDENPNVWEQARVTRLGSAPADQSSYVVLTSHMLL
jgi:hypothetical protein